MTRRSALCRGAALAAATAMLPLLQACAQTPAPAASPSPAAVATSVSAAGTPSRATALSIQPTAGGARPAGATQSVTWLVPATPQLQGYATKGVVPTFEQAYPSTKVDVVSPANSSTGYSEKLFALVAGGVVPEVFTDWGGASFLTLRNRQLVTNLSPYFAQAGLQTDYLQTTYLKEYTADGNLYAVPWESNPVFLIYNKTLFAQYNVPLPPTDWNDRTWTTDKLLSAAQALTHATGNPATSTFGLTMSAGSCGSLAWLWDTDAFNNTGGPEDSAAYHGAPLTQVYATRQGMVDAMTWLANLTLKYHVAPTAAESAALPPPGNPFFSGRVGMQRLWGGGVVQLAVSHKPSFQWGIAPYPYGPGGRNTMQREDNGWYLGRRSKNPDAGFRLLLFASRGQGADDLINYVRFDPPLADATYLHKWTKSIASLPGFGMSAQEFATVFGGSVTASWGDPINILDDSLEFFNAFNTLMAPALTGQQSPLAGLQAVQATWQGLIAALPKTG